LLKTRRPAAEDDIAVMTPPVAEKVIIDIMRRAGEEPFARAAMLPLLHAAFPSLPD